MHGRQGATAIVCGDKLILGIESVSLEGLNVI